MHRFWNLQTVAKTVIALFLFDASLATNAQPAKVVSKWFKGNTHAHTLRSDGDSTPEEVTTWYKDNGYNFLFITDHETITPVDELNRVFGTSGMFAVFTAQEITDRVGGKPYHVNALGVSSVITPN